MRRATIQDVAATAGVSTATVSRVLNGQGVTASTAARVRDAVARLEYSPNALTKGVFAGRSRTIGVLVRDLTSPFYLELMRGTDDVAAAHGSLVMFADTSRRADQEIAQVRAMDEQRVRGLIVTAGEATDERIRRMAAGGTPCVVVARTVDDAPPNLHSISLDNVAAGRLIGAHLVACERSSVGVVRSGLRPSQDERVQGLREVLPERAVRIAETPDDVPAAVAGLLSDGPLDAVVCLTGRLTVHVYGALHALGRTVPGDVAFLTMDDFPWAPALGITVVTQPAYAMGQRAAELVVGGAAEATRLVLAPGLVARRSCGEHVSERVAVVEGGCRV